MSDHGDNPSGGNSPILYHSDSPYASLPLTPTTHRLRPEAEAVRRFCYSTPGLIFQISLNSVMVLLTTFIISYEFLELQHNKLAPIWFICIDVGIVLVLVIEVAVRYVEANVSFEMYFVKKVNRFDFCVMLFSVFTLSLYFFTSKYADDAEETILILRIFRDVVRFARMIVFVRSMSITYIDFQHMQKPDHTKHDVKVSHEDQQINYTGSASFSPKHPYNKYFQNPNALTNIFHAP